MVEGLLPLEGGLDGDREVVLQLLLADELRQAPGAEGRVEGFLVLLEVPGYYAFFSRRRGTPFPKICAIR